MMAALQKPHSKMHPLPQDHYNLNNQKVGEGN